jgi:hypothetical protein
LIVLVLVGEHLVFNPFEAQIDTGIWCKSYWNKQFNDILILNQQTVTSFVDKE